jgi:amidohydrolase
VPSIPQTEIREAAKALEAKTVAVRRELHAHPEIGFEEVQTAARIARTLGELGIDHRTGVAKTGVLATLRGTSSGPGAGRAVQLRADMDCLPLQERNDVPYRSKRDGFMHACGHDGHVAILLGAAELLHRARSRWSGTVRLAFQPGEEGYGGAVPLIAEGALADPECGSAYALHIWNNLPVGQIGVRPGPAMAAVDEFYITVLGRGGHASEPSATADPIIAASHLVIALQTIVSRNIEAIDAGVCTVGSLHGGTTHNIIPDRAELIGTLRSFRPEVREVLRRRVGEIARGIAGTFGCTAEVTLHGGYPATVNDERAAALATLAATDVAGAANVTPAKPVMGGEDFSYFLAKVPGAMMFLGSSNPERGLAHPHHSPQFDFDEACLATGIELMSTVALRALDTP